MATLVDEQELVVLFNILPVHEALFDCSRIQGFSDPRTQLRNWSET